MGLSRDDLKLLMHSFDESAWTEMTLIVRGTRLELTSTGRPPAATGPLPTAPEPPDVKAGSPPARSAGTPPATVATAPVGDQGLHQVLAPSVGIFYRAPGPEAPPFVTEGADVEAEDIVCIVEVMKLMNHVKAGACGVVRSIHVENGAMIEHGQLLFTIEAGRA